MSYGHKSLVQKESRSILTKSGWCKISNNLWVRRSVAVEKHGLQDWKTEEERIEKDFLEALQRYKTKNFFIKLFTKKPRRQKNLLPYNKVIIEKPSKQLRKESK